MYVKIKREFDTTVVVLIKSKEKKPSRQTRKAVSVDKSYPAVA